MKFEDPSSNHPDFPNLPAPAFPLNDGRGPVRIDIERPVSTLPPREKVTFPKRERIPTAAENVTRFLSELTDLGFKRSEGNYVGLLPISTFNAKFGQAAISLRLLLRNQDDFACWISEGNRPYVAAGAQTFNELLERLHEYANAHDHTQNAS